MEVGPLGENPKTEYRAANLHVQREVVSGVRRVWGTVKSASHFTVKNTIVKLADVESVDSIHVKRKHKTTRIRFTDSHACGSPMDQSSVSQKRKDRSSPLPSPQKLTRSPLPKIQKRHCTGTEGQQEMGKLPPAPKPHLQATQQRTCYSSSLPLITL